MKLSVVVPAYRQQETIYRDVQNIRQALSSLDLDYEVIVVVDGNVDGTYEASLPLRGDGVVVLGYSRNQGKGHAVRQGMTAASGDIVGFIDAGSDLDARDLARAVQQLIDHQADAVVGSKRHVGSQVHYPFIRRCYSLVYQLITWALFGLNVRDTQAGLKVFRRQAVDQALPLLSIKRYAFDVEFLAIMRMLGFSRIEEAPIRVRLAFSSSVGVRSIATMLWDTASVFIRLRVLRHYQRLAASHAQKDTAYEANNAFTAS